MRLAAVLALALLLAGTVCIVGTSSYRYAQQDREAIAVPPSTLHLAGTDELGRDRALRLSLAVLLCLSGACCASALASAASVSMAFFAALCPAWVRAALLYAGDLFLTLPWIFLLMLVRSALPLALSPERSGFLTFLLLGLLGVPAFLRLHHEKVMLLLRADWVIQAQAAGLRRSQLGRQLLPHLRPLLWTQFLLYIPACLVAEANLGTLGLGLSEPLPSWGSLLANLQGAALVSNSSLIYLPLVTLVLVLVAVELMFLGVER